MDRFDFLQREMQTGGSCMGHVDFRIQPPTVVPELLIWESFGTVSVGNALAMESQPATLSPENLASLYLGDGLEHFLLFHLLGTVL